VNAVVCSKKKKGDKIVEEKNKKGLDRADIVRDFRFALIRWKEHGIVRLTQDFVPHDFAVQ
jgi:hypothetical protein